MSPLVGPSCERDDALRDAQAVCQEYGMPVTLRVRGETGVRRDLYGSIKNRTEDSDGLTIGSMPFIFNPNRRDLERAGLREASDAVAYLATKDLTDNGLNFDTLDAERTTVSVSGVQHRIVEKGQHSHFLDAALYVVLSLKRL